MLSDTKQVELKQLYVVDDDEAVLRSVEALLSQSGYHVTTYLSARQMLAEVPLDSAGCVITDVQMPDINGLQLMRKLVEARSSLSVVVISGVADVPTTVAIMESGAATLLEKPYDQAELLRAVERALSISHERWKRQLEQASVRQRLATLSSEELSVMTLMLKDAPNKAIARSLNLSMRTVDRRRQSVLFKMQTASVPELAKLLGSTECLPNDAPESKGQ